MDPNNKAREEGREWAKGMTLSEADKLDVELQAGSFDWREWFSKKPAPAFWVGVYDTWKVEHPGRF